MSPKRPKQQIMQLLRPGRRPNICTGRSASSSRNSGSCAYSGASRNNSFCACYHASYCRPAKGNRVFASPLARRIAADAGLDIASVTGSGPHGRIIRADVEEALATGIASPAMAVSAASGAAVSAQSERFEPHSAMRRVIAERLQHFKQNAPHFYLTVECEIDNLLEARKALNEAAPEGVKISVNDMVVKAAAAALVAVPEVNGYFEEAGCRYFSE